MKDKERLDKLIVELGLTDSRAKAQALIMAGNVRVDGQVSTKAGALFPREAEISIEGVRQWASRGAHKLLGAFDAFEGLNVEGRVCADFGASTGGFTDVLLSRGASRVYAVDVGYGQLLWHLASNPRVIVMDRTNARYLTHEDFPEQVEFGVCDVSFISLKLILPVLDDVIRDEAVVLIKPQFEAGRERISKGVVRDRAVHTEILRDMMRFIDEDTGFCVAGLTHSPLRGPEGNIEFLCRVTHRGVNVDYDVDAIVNSAHEKLGR